MALQNLLGDLATDAKLETLRLLLAAAATDAKLEAVRVLLAEGLTVTSTSSARNYTATTFNLTAGQAAGTDPLIAANANRKGLMFRADVDFELALAAAQTKGMRIYASARDSLIGGECPLGALYLVNGSGLNAGDTLTVWEA